MSSRIYPGAKISRRLPGPKSSNLGSMIGAFSAVSPLVATGILFLIGWAYLTNWYGYFGISTSQINIQAQDILIQSIPVLVTLLSIFVAALLLYAISFLVLDHLKQVINIFRRKGSYLPGRVQPFEFKDWLIVLGILGVMLFGLYIYYTSSISERIGGIPESLYEITYFYYSLSMVYAGTMIGLAVIMPLIFVVIIVRIALRVRDRINLSRIREIGGEKNPSELCSCSWKLLLLS
jgi:hypothetical protein